MTRKQKIMRVALSVTLIIALMGLVIFAIKLAKEDAVKVTMGEFEELLKAEKESNAKAAADAKAENDKLRNELAAKAESAKVTWPTVFENGLVDTDADSIDDRYSHKLSTDGKAICDDWAYTVHPRVGRVALPIDSQKGAYFGDVPPLVRCMPELNSSSMRWAQVAFGDWDDEGNFVNYPGLNAKLRVCNPDGSEEIVPVQVGWVVVENGGIIPPNDPQMRPEMVVVVRPPCDGQL